MRFLFSLALFSCFLMAGAVTEAETKRLAKSGDWVAMRTDVPFAVEKDSTLVFGDVCTARSGSDSAYFSVSVLPDGTTLVQVASEQWDWPGRRRDAKVVLGNANVLLQDALYWDDFIDHGTMAEHGGYSSMQILATQSGNIEVFDHRDRLIARFSSRGFKAMLERTIRCAK